MLLVCIWSYLCEECEDGSLLLCRQGAECVWLCGGDSEGMQESSLNALRACMCVWAFFLSKLCAMVW